ncbi:hypothetical protein QAD02_002741 [Eretmocerus hayati]|uniref:Uncharacterized protein n=1 Tax=Eretmocerus hayati TaxID=131215 RepID=A0ACC2NK56_9HYME|nr:hypothetical protein QAD02_002741 [Eretmocerus hayati]
MACNPGKFSTKQKFNKLLEEYLIKHRDDNNFALIPQKYDSVVQEVKESKVEKSKTPRDLRRLARYDVLVVSDREKLIQPLKKDDAAVSYYVTTEELFDIIDEIHQKTGHGGRNRMLHKSKIKYCNITRTAVMMYLSVCEDCQRKRPVTSKGHVSQTILSKTFASRGQVDLIDMQSKEIDGFLIVVELIFAISLVL